MHAGRARRWQCYLRLSVPHTQYPRRTGIRFRAPFPFLLGALRRPRNHVRCRRACHGCVAACLLRGKRRRSGATPVGSAPGRQFSPMGVSSARRIQCRRTNRAALSRAGARTLVLSSMLMGAERWRGVWPVICASGSAPRSLHRRVA